MYKLKRKIIIKKNINVVKKSRCASPLRLTSDIDKISTSSRRM
jgi:hypothetical protein